MAFRDGWHKALLYFGLAEERAYVDEYAEEREQYAARERQQQQQRAPIAEPEAELEDRYRERPNVRRLAPRRPRRDDFDDIFPDDEPRGNRPTTVLRPAPRTETCACTS